MLPSSTYNAHATKLEPTLLLVDTVVHLIVSWNSVNKYMIVRTCAGNNKNKQFFMRAYASEDNLIYVTESWLFGQECWHRYSCHIASSVLSRNDSLFMNEFSESVI